MSVLFTTCMLNPLVSCTIAMPCRHLSPALKMISPWQRHSAVLNPGSPSQQHQQKVSPTCSYKPIPDSSLTYLCKPLELAMRPAKRASSHVAQNAVLNHVLICVCVYSAADDLLLSPPKASVRSASAAAAPFVEVLPDFDFPELSMEFDELL